MAQIEVSDSVAAKIALLAKAWRVSHGGAVQRLLEEFESDLRDEPVDPGLVGKQIPVHVDYQGAHVEGVYDRNDRSLTITSGPALGRRFPSPSAAAIAVVSALNPGIHPNRNGWSFWIVTATGNRLQSVRYL
jgi:hypothetical protein